jgi:uncharacterized Zn finger protein
VPDAAGSFSAPFVEMFEALRMAPVFARGRRDARAGHVRSLTISGSLAVALVRGPEEVAAQRARIAVRGFGASEWARVEDALAAEARYAAALLSGRMPADVDRVFADAGLHLLPLSLDEIAMDCSCERWPMPCAHVAATVYALARSFDADPFGAFAWRGRPRDELLHRLHQLRGAAAIEATAPADDLDEAPDAGLGEIADFWGVPGMGFGGYAGSAGPGVGAVPPDVDGTAIGERSDSSAAGGAAGRIGGAAGMAGNAGRIGRAAGAIEGAVPAAVRPDALLDQLDVPPPLAEILRPAYRALP